MMSTVKSLALVVAVLARSAVAQQGCAEPDAELVPIDFDVAVVSGGSVSGYAMGIFDPSLVVDFTTSARLINRKGGDARETNLYNSSDVGGADEDLENAKIGNVLIIQEDGVTVPDDEQEGGLLTMEFTHNAATLIALAYVSVIDVERNTHFTTTVNGDDTVNTVPAGADGATQTINSTDTDEGLTKIVFRFPGSGAVGDVYLCLRKSDVIGDPHVRRYGGKGEKRSIYLRPKEWTHMFAGPRYELQGRVFERPGFEPGTDMLPVEWFDGMAVIDHGEDGSSAITVVNVTMPHDATVGHVNDELDVPSQGPRIDYFHVEVGDRFVGASNATYVSEDGQVSLRAYKLGTSVLEGVLDDALVITTPDFSFRLQNEATTNTHVFSTRAEQLRLTHLDVSFLHLDQQKVHGPLAEIIFKDDEELSETALQWMDKANAYAVADMS